MFATQVTINLRIDRLTSRVLDAAGEGLEAGGNEIAKHAAAKHGRARPGEFVPDSMRQKNPDGSYRYVDRTGNLSGSIKVGDAKRTRDRVECDVTAGPEYAAAIEFGIGRAREFPFMRPAANEKAKTVAQMTANAIREALR